MLLQAQATLGMKSTQARNLRFEERNQRSTTLHHFQRPDQKFKSTKSRTHKQARAQTPTTIRRNSSTNPPKAQPQRSSKVQLTCLVRHSELVSAVPDPEEDGEDAGGDDERSGDRRIVCQGKKRTPKGSIGGNSAGKGRIDAGEF